MDGMDDRTFVATRLFPCAMYVLPLEHARPPWCERREDQSIQTDWNQLFVPDNQPPNAAFGGCPLTGIPLSSGRHLGNLGMDHGSGPEAKRDPMTDGSRVDPVRLLRHRGLCLSVDSLREEARRRRTKVGGETCRQLGLQD